MDDHPVSAWSQQTESQRAEKLIVRKQRSKPDHLAIQQVSRAESRRTLPPTQEEPLEKVLIVESKPSGEADKSLEQAEIPVAQVIMMSEPSSTVLVASAQTLLVAKPKSNRVTLKDVANSPKSGHRLRKGTPRYISLDPDGRNEQISKDTNVRQTTSEPGYQAPYMSGIAQMQMQRRKIMTDPMSDTKYLQHARVKESLRERIKSNAKYGSSRGSCTDPLNAVSAEEDKASLVMLASFIDVCNSPDAELIRDGNIKRRTVEHGSRDQTSPIDRVGPNALRDPVLIAVLHSSQETNLSRDHVLATKQNENDVFKHTSSRGGPGHASKGDEHGSQRRSQHVLARQTIVAGSVPLFSISLPRRERTLSTSADLTPSVPVTTIGGVGFSTPQPKRPLATCGTARPHSVRELAARFNLIPSVPVGTSEEFRPFRVDIRRPLPTRKPNAASPYTHNTSLSPSKSNKSHVVHENVHDETPTKRGTSMNYRGEQDDSKRRMLMGRTTSMRRGTQLPFQEAPSVPQYVQYPRPTTAPLEAYKEPIHVDGTLSSKSSTHSILHARIRALQRQLALKEEEARQLKRQLDTRDNIDIGTLSEQVRTVKRDLQFWKTRAEVAENRLEHSRRMYVGISSVDDTSTSVTSTLAFPHDGTDTDFFMDKRATPGGRTSGRQWTLQSSDATVIREEGKTSNITDRLGEGFS